MSSSDRTILVTGGAGYIGSHVCKALAEAGFRPVVYDNMSTGNEWAVRWGPLERGDICDPERLAEAFGVHRPVAVMHLAALALVGEPMAAPALYYRTNVSGTLTLANACRTFGVTKLVLPSTCAVYGDPGIPLIGEDAPKNPINPYGASKLMVERILADYDRAYGMRHAALRCFNAAGADAEGEIGERRSVETHLVPLAIDAAMGRRQPLTIFGSDYPTPDGTAIRDYIHVSDLAAAHVRALDLLLAGTPSFQINLGTGRGYSVREVIESVSRALGTEVPHRVEPRRPGDPPCLVADPAAAGKLLGQGVIAHASLDRIIESACRWHATERCRVSFEQARDAAR